MTLLKKALRAIWENKKTYVACGLLLSLGVLLYVAMAIAANALEESTQRYYADYHMADGFISLTGMPASRLDVIEGIEGIETALGRLVYEARVEMEDNDKIITLRLISYYEGQPEVNEYYISYGTPLSGWDDIMVGEDFLTAHQMNTGDSLRLIIEGREYSFQVTAGVLSPEYVYMMKDMTSMLPEPETYGFAYVEYAALAAITNNTAVYNDLCFTLAQGHTFEEVKPHLEDALSRYGIISMIGKEDQLSYAMLDTEITGIKSMGSSISIVFVMASMIILYLMLKRVVEADRTQIGTLKAFGFTNREVLWHYLTYGVITGLVGGVIGALLGLASSTLLVDLVYAEFFRMPEIRTVTSNRILMEGIIISIAGGLFGSFMGAYSITKLEPAQAMRPKPPKTVKKDILEHMPPIRLLLNSRGHMAVRSIGRNKVRSIFIIVGMMFSFGLMAFMNSFDDIFDAMMFDQFEKIQVYDARVTFKTPVDAIAAVENFYHIPYVTQAESLMELGVELKSNHLRENVVITGIEEASSLYYVYDSEKQQKLDLKGDGLILSDSLAKKLNAEIGDFIYVASPYLQEDRKVLVTGIVSQSLGNACYIQSKTLSELLDIHPVATSVIFTASDMPHVKEALLKGANVAAVDDIADTYRTYQDFMGAYSGMIGFLKVFGILVALAIIYNTSVISLMERKREYATLRVIGLEVGEVAEIMDFEVWLLSMVGMLLGIPFTRLLKELISTAMEVELFTIPTYTAPSSYVIAAAGCMAAIVISNFMGKKSIAGFDIVEVLKERE